MLDKQKLFNWVPVLFILMIIILGLSGLNITVSPNGSSQVGRYQAFVADNSNFMLIDTATGEVKSCLMLVDGEVYEPVTMKTACSKLIDFSQDKNKTVFKQMEGFLLEEYQEDQVKRRSEESK